MFENITVFEAMVWSPNWNVSFSEQTEITYSELPKGYVCGPYRQNIN